MTNSTLYRLVDSVIDTSTPVESWKFTLEEIRSVLGTLPRYLGRSKRSVLTHSCRVADAVVVDLTDKGCSDAVVFAGSLRGLYHDASEAFTGDVPGPIKRCLGQAFRDFEDRIQAKVYDMAGVSTRAIVGLYGTEVLMQINAAVARADQEDFEWEQASEGALRG